MDKKYHNLLNLLFEIGHPFPEDAVKRAIFAKNRKGAGLTKIPLSVIEEDFSKKSDAKTVFDAIEDDVEYEVSYLIRKDTELEAELGFEEALSYYYKGTEYDEINGIELPIKLGNDLPIEFTGGLDIGASFRGIYRQVDEVFANDVVRGYDRADQDRKRIKQQFKEIIERVAGG